MKTPIGQWCYKCRKFWYECKCDHREVKMDNKGQTLLEVILSIVIAFLTVLIFVRQQVYFNHTIEAIRRPATVQRDVADAFTKEEVTHALRRCLDEAK